MMESFWIFGVIALVAGIVILLFPKLFFWLIGIYMVVNAFFAFEQGADFWVVGLLGVGGVLIFVSPKMVARVVAFYLILLAGLLYFLDYPQFAVPALVFAGIVLLIPKIVPAAVGGLLSLAGAAVLVAAFLL